MQAQTVASIHHKKRDRLGDISNEPRKRRSRYALRACHECKRRKVRCDGHIPCEHCRGRSIECNYDTDPRLLSNCVCNDSCSINDSNEPGGDSKEDISEVGRLTRLVENMQAQISTLIELNKPPNYSPGQQGYSAAREKQSLGSGESLPSEPTNTICSAGTSHNNGVEVSEPRYWGATSSDYTLNVVHFHIQPMQPQKKSSQTPSCDNTESSYVIQVQKPYSKDGSCERIGESGRAARPKRACFCLECTRPLRMLSKADAHRLVSAYQEVVNCLHPILDMSYLSSQIDIIYTNLESGTEIEEDKKLQVDPDSVEILKIVLSIALLTQTTKKSEIASVLYESFRSKLQDATMSPTENIQGVLLTLLMSIYYFFDDEIQLAWRLCGIAGRMAMELGLHRRNVRQQVEDSGRAHSNVTNILWSIVILDRLWSCSIGLPQNFQDADFAKCLPEPVERKAPYLKAMASYASFSTRLWDSNSRMITADALEDEDLFDFTNIQVDQWRERSLTGLPFVHPKDRTVSDIPPQSLPTLLYLRANQIRGLMIRSYFLSDSSLASKDRVAQSGVELACDAIDILADLDATTDIYRKQRPFFQHFLASSVALLFLIITNESKEHFESPMAEKFLPVNMSKSISGAFKLAAAYSDVSSASYRLWKRMVGALSRLDNLLVKQSSHQAQSIMPNEPQNYSWARKILLGKNIDEHISQQVDKTRHYSGMMRSNSSNVTDHNDSLGFLDSAPLYGLMDNMSSPGQFMDSETVFGLDNISSPGQGADVRINDIQRLGMSMDDQAWRELNALFTQEL